MSELEDRVAEVMNPDWRPPTLEELMGEPGDPVTDLEALRRAWFD